MSQEFDNIAAQILVVDDEEDHAEVMAEALRRMGHVCTIVHDLPNAQDELKHGTFDLVVTDLKMEGEEDGMEVLQTARQTQPNAETIMVTAHGDVPTAKGAIRGGAYDFIEKPLDLDSFRTLAQRAIQTVMLRDENTELKQRLDEQFGFEGIVGTSPAMRNVLKTMKQFAPTTTPILITGESGTGKELVAQAIHQNSKRNSAKFVPLNCAGLNESTLEDELFGHIKGAFTGADRDREGRFEYADKGTLFLDEVGDMPLPMQAKLLRVLESGEVVRIGANDPKHVNVRLISATNKNLEDAVASGEFREDLYFRIKGVELRIPALRERREDIPELVQHFVHQFAKEFERDVPEIGDDTNTMLMRYHWPGNVRQLITVVRNAVVVAESKLEPRNLPPEIAQNDGESDEGGTSVPTGLTLDQLEKQAIRNALRVAQGNRAKAAEMLGIAERTFYRKLKEYGIK